MRLPRVRFTTSALVATIGVLAIARGAIATLPESRTTTDDATALSVLQGTWIVRAYPSGQPLGLVHVDVKDQQPRAALLAVGQPNFYRLKGSGIEGFRFDGESVRFTLRLVQEGNPSAKLFPVVAYLPDREGLPKVLPGSVEVSGFRYPVELERSDQKELTPTEAEALAPGNAELRQFNQAESVEKRKQILQGILEKYPDRPSLTPLQMP